MVKSIVVSTARLPKTLVEKLKIYAEYFYLDETLNKEEILSNAEVLITWGQDFDYKEIRKMKKLKAIQTLSAVVDHVPFKEIQDSVLLYSNAGAYSEQCGEFAWALILALSKGLNNIVLERQKYLEGIYSKPRRINNSKILIFGTGGIGKTVARIGKGFKTYNVGVNRSGNKPEFFNEVLSSEVAFERLSDFDIVVIALPLNKYTYKLFKYEQLVKLKDESILVNVGRGDIVDEESLYKVLKERPSIRYGSDVWWKYDDKEAFETKTGIHKLPNAIFTPHISGVSGKGFIEESMSEAIENVIRIITNNNPRNLVDTNDYI
ncbi:MAG: hydroxyacid dehydrogenase [Candidatus Brockarchaeota archaeon]|nr:hydroxyacid dehydrogenase [Candidatus Brockarchaeota archaeon]